MNDYKDTRDRLFLAEHRMKTFVEENPKFTVPKSVLKVFSEVNATLKALQTALNIVEEEAEEKEMKKSKKSK